MADDPVGPKGSLDAGDPGGQQVDGPGEPEVLGGEEGANSSTNDDNKERRSFLLPSLWLYGLVTLVLVVEIIVAFRLSSTAEHGADGTLDLSGLNLSGQVFAARTLTGADLRASDLNEAVFTAAVLSGADLSLSCLRYAQLRNADLKGALLVAADLRGADLTFADVDDATDFAGAVYDGSTLWMAGGKPEGVADAAVNPWMACEARR